MVHVMRVQMELENSDAVINEILAFVERRKARPT